MCVYMQTYDNYKQMHYLDSKIYWWPLLNIYVLQYIILRTCNISHDH